MAKKPTEKAAEKSPATSSAAAKKAPAKKTIKAKSKKKETVKVKVEATPVEAISVETTHDVAVVEEVKASKEDNKVAQAEFLDTFYTWPLVLPQELVYFFRTGALIEGMAFNYDVNFDGFTFIKGVVLENHAELLRSTGQRPSQIAKNFLDEAQSAVRSVRDLVTRAEREELRVRVHPRDIQGAERFVHLQARRLLLSIFASATAVITSILFIALRNWFLLGAGLLAALVMFTVVLFIPTHLLENPLRHARGVRPDEWK